MTRTDEQQEIVGQYTEYYRTVLQLRDESEYTGLDDWKAERAKEADIRDQFISELAETGTTTRRKAKATAEQIEKQEQRRFKARKEAEQTMARKKQVARQRWLNQGGDPEEFETLWPELKKRAMFDQLTQATSSDVAYPSF